MAYAKDLTGERFGRLLVQSRNYDEQNKIYAKTGRKVVFWNCICDCGNRTIVRASNLKNKTNPTLSCGCLFKEKSHMQKNTKDNQWRFDGDIAIGITSKGEEFFIDIEDYDLAKNYCWRINPETGYVIANSRDGTNKIVWLHRLIMNVTNQSIYVDHSNWDKSNNRKSNLRIATKSENNTNIKRKTNNTSGYTGVTVNKRTGKYVARITKNKRRIYLGTFNSFEDAINARHEAELVLHGEWSGEINRKDYYYYDRRTKH